VLLHLRALYQRVEVVVSSTIKATQMPMVEAVVEVVAFHLRILQQQGRVIPHQPHLVKGTAVVTGQRERRDQAVAAVLAVWV
jgi:hypothetical protein